MSEFCIANFSVIASPPWSERRKGFTLIEIVLVLAVGLGIIIGGITFYRQASFTSEFTNTLRETRMLVADISEYAERTNSSYIGPEYVAQSTIIENLSIYHKLDSVGFETIYGTRLLSISINLSTDICLRMAETPSWEYGGDLALVERLYTEQFGSDAEEQLRQVLRSTCENLGLFYIYAST